MAWIGHHRGERALLLNHNLHSVYLHARSPGFRRLYERADAIVIDGTPVRLAASLVARRMLGSRWRIGSTDWIARLPQLTRGPRRLFVYGGTAAANRACVERLRTDLPDWTVDGVNGFAERESSISVMQEFAPDLVLVGMGMPLQEEFLLANLDRLPPAVYATVGGAIDYVAGVASLAPRWIGGIGLEWAWRLLHDPRRLARRYLVEPLALPWLIVRSRRARRRAEPSEATS